MLTEIWLSIGVLFFGAIAICVTAWVTYKKSDKGWGPYSARNFGLTLVIVAGLFLITGGWAPHQTAPIFPC